MDRKKIAPNLLKVIEDMHALDMHEIPIIIKREETSHIDSVGMRHFSLVPMVALKASADEIFLYSTFRTVHYIWLDEEVHTCLDQSVPQIHVPYVWDKGYTGMDMSICIVDTGVDNEHPGLYGGRIERVDFTGEGVQDDNGHGTHCAGIAAGFGDYLGVAYDAEILSAKVLDREGSGRWSDVMAGVEWAVSAGADVISLSLGSPGPSDGTDPLSEMCNVAAEWCVVCVAAGNAGPVGRVGSPGAAEKVITVGSVGRYDTVSSFSSRGPTLDGRNKPDICMPGESIVSCRARGTTLGPPINDLYVSASGTSMATPHAAGLAALLLEAGVEVQDVKQILMKTAKDVGESSYAQGSGRGDAERAYRYIQGEEPPPEEPGCLIGKLLSVWQK